MYTSSIHIHCHHVWHFRVISGHLCFSVYLGLKCSMNYSKLCFTCCFCFLSFFCKKKNVCKTDTRGPRRPNSWLFATQAMCIRLAHRWKKCIFINKTIVFVFHHCCSLWLRFWSWSKNGWSKIDPKKNFCNFRK